jgi:hypothetical protein
MGSKIKARLQALWAKLNTDLRELWAKDKVFVILFGVILAIIKFRQGLIGLAVWSGKSLFNSTTTTTSNIQQQENQANNQANQLVDDANKLPSTETPVSDDWNISK